MCQWISFLASDSGEIFPGDLRSHSAAERLHGVDTRRAHIHEAEWTADGPDSLAVRVADSERADAGELREKVLRRWPTRREFIWHWAPKCERLDCSNTPLTALPALPKCEVLDCDDELKKKRGRTK